VKTDDAGLDSVKQAKINNWHSDLKKDITLFETYRIMLDMIEK